MIFPILNLPNAILGFALRGQVTREQLFDAIIPAIQHNVKMHYPINILLLIESSVSSKAAQQIIEYTFANLFKTVAIQDVALLTNQPLLEALKDRNKTFAKPSVSEFKISQMNDAIAYISNKLHRRQQIVDNNIIQAR